MVSFISNSSFFSAVLLKKSKMVDATAAVIAIGVDIIGKFHTQPLLLTNFTVFLVFITFINTEFIIFQKIKGQKLLPPTKWRRKIHSKRPPYRVGRRKILYFPYLINLQWLKFCTIQSRLDGLICRLITCISRPRRNAPGLRFSTSSTLAVPFKMRRNLATESRK